MLSRISRFKGHNSLNSVYRYGQSVNTDKLTLKYLKLKSGKLPRAAVVVSRKVNKKAVIRNRIRRRIYEELRLTLQESKLNSDIVLVVYDDKYAEVASIELKETISDLLNKSQVIEKK